MATFPTGPCAIRFGSFEMNLETEELRKNGLKLKLQGQPFRVLATLVERAPRIVTREDLQSQLWPKDTFVDFDHGLNNSILKIRETLGDCADNPRFIETIPRRGYRFLFPIEVVRKTSPGGGIASDRGVEIKSGTFSVTLQDVRQHLLVASTPPELTSLRYRVEDLIDGNQGHSCIHEARLLLDDIKSALDYSLLKMTIRLKPAKLRVSPETAAGVFDDPDALSLSDGFGRWRTVGMVLGQTVLVVDHAMSEVRGNEIVRIIAARKATPGERRFYEQKKKQED
jgi:DNA-binding winged helix-turn-helix (wHTH) protein/uncharacterized DUF497 family protein